MNTGTQSGVTRAGQSHRVTLSIPVSIYYTALRGQGLSAGTVRRVHGVLHAALAQAQR